MFGLEPVLMIMIISTVVSFTLALSYKLLTNQEELKGVNEELKELNAKFKEAQKNKDQKELMKLQTRMLEINSKKMKNTMKPMMASFLIIIPVFVFIFPALYGDLVVKLDDSLAGTAEFGGKSANVQFVKEGSAIVINGEEKTPQQTMEIGDKEFVFKSFDDGKKEVTLKMIAVNLPFSMPIWGERLGWLGWYILFSIPLTSVFRKVLGVVQ